VECLLDYVFALLAYVKDEVSNLRTMTIVLKFVMSVGLKLAINFD
jgi:hypothetical protein